MGDEAEVLKADATVPINEIKDHRLSSIIT
jgi:hypothetical protein